MSCITKTQVITNINSTITDNCANEVTAADVRSVLNDIINYAEHSGVAIEFSWPSLVQVDDVVKDVPRFVVPSGTTMNIRESVVTLGVAGSSTTTVELYLTNDAGGAAPTPGAALSSLTLASGVVRGEWSAIEGQQFTSLQHVQARVSGAGSEASDLSIYLICEMCK